jgi:hypothetical protein
MVQKKDRTTASHSNATAVSIDFTGQIGDSMWKSVFKALRPHGNVSVFYGDDDQARHGVQIVQVQDTCLRSLSVARSRI